MKAIVIAAVMVCVSVIPTVVLAGGFETGNALLDECNSTTGVELGECLGYIVGVADTLNQPDKSFVIENGKTIPTLHICLREGVTKGQLKDIALMYLRAHPEFRDYAADGPISIGLAAAFPCR